VRRYERNFLRKEGVSLLGETIKGKPSASARVRQGKKRTQQESVKLGFLPWARKLPEKRRGKPVTKKESEGLGKMKREDMTRKMKGSADRLIEKNN